MPYVLHEVPESGDKTSLGEPVHDLIVAKVIASRRAVRMQRVTVVTDESTGEEVARYLPTEPPPPKESIQRMRAAPPEEESDWTHARKKKSG